MSGTSYKDAGVDLDRYQQSMARLPELLRRTNRPGVLELPGGFAGLFRLNDAGSWTDPVLVSGTDGVGTKLKIAFALNRYDTVGIDLVAMCVNDVLCLGAEPLFFLDYIAMDCDDPDRTADLVAGVCAGCQQAGAALIAGETAIMPAVYAPGEFDMAGFAVGVVERADLIDGRERIRAGDVVIGLASNGFHSNGYSLIRKVVFEDAGLSADDSVAGLDQSVGEILLRPTRIYADVLREVRARIPADSLHGLAHITGGGLAENVERILGEQVAIAIERQSWTVPREFSWLDELGRIGADEMARVFNMGIGFVLIVSADAVDGVVAAASDCGIESFRLGDVEAGQKAVTLRD